MKTMQDEKKGNRIRAFRAAFPYTIPVLTGYLFIGMAFGVMIQEKGYNFLWAMLMSLLIYAGSGQYLAVNFFAPGVSLLHVIFMEFMLNIRHIFYGLSLLERFSKMGKKRLYMIFSLTDETYSLFFVTKVPPDVREDPVLLDHRVGNRRAAWKCAAVFHGGNRFRNDSAVCSYYDGAVDGAAEPWECYHRIVLRTALSYYFRGG